MCCSDYEAIQLMTLMAFQGQMCQLQLILLPLWVCPVQHQLQLHQHQVHAPWLATGRVDCAAETSILYPCPAMLLYSVADVLTSVTSVLGTGWSRYASIACK